MNDNLILVDKGTIFDVQELIDDLANMFERTRFAESNPEIRPLDSLVFIENHEGCWTIGFEDIPQLAVVMYLIALFDSKYQFDAITRLVFNMGKKNQKVYEEVAGEWGSFGEKKMRVLYWVYKNRDNRIL